MAKALVVLSGGQDSTTCLHWALKKFGAVEAITFDYGQKHRVEIGAAVTIAKRFNVPHTIRDMKGIFGGTSPLINSDYEVGQYSRVAEMPGGVEPTFVPGRNIMFLTAAASYGVTIDAHHLVTGVCEEDYGGYPDCRRVFIEQLAAALTLGLFGDDTTHQIHIHTPLMNLTKAQTVMLLWSLGVEVYRSLEYTHTCYKGEQPPCLKCHACIIRARGFHDAGLPDPLITHHIGRGNLPEDMPYSGFVEASDVCNCQCHSGATDTVAGHLCCDAAIDPPGFNPQTAPGASVFGTLENLADEED